MPRAGVSSLMGFEFTARSLASFGVAASRPKYAATSETQKAPANPIGTITKRALICAPRNMLSDTRMSPRSGLRFNWKTVRRAHPRDPSRFDFRSYLARTVRLHRPRVNSKFAVADECEYSCVRLSGPGSFVIPPTIIKTGAYRNGIFLHDATRARASGRGCCESRMRSCPTRYLLGFALAERFIHPVRPRSYAPLLAEWLLAIGVQH